MPVTDDQLEMLEAYLDGELPSDQETAVRAQLTNETELAAVLRSLQAERDMRGLVWKACEPDDNTVRRHVMKVQAQVDRQSVWAMRYAKWRIPSAAAACILIGFFVGWLIRGTPNSAAVNPGTIAANNVTLPSGPTPPVVNVGATNLNLPLVDEFGRKVGTQHFKSEAEMQAYIEALLNWQHSQEKVQNGNVTESGAQKF